MVIWLPDKEEWYQFQASQEYFTCRVITCRIIHPIVVFGGRNAKVIGDANVSFTDVTRIAALGTCIDSKKTKS